MTRYAASEPLDSTRHQADAFTCGQPTLDLWLRAYASQGQRRDASRTFVVTDHDKTIAGYYTVVACQIEHASATATVREGMARHFPIPAVLIARLAVDQAHQGAGLGRSLLLDALTRSQRAARDLGIRAVLVHAINDDAARFYRHYGFEPSHLDPHVLMVTMSAVRKAIAST